MFQMKLEVEFFKRTKWEVGVRKRGIGEMEPRGGVIDMKHPTMSFCPGGI